MTFVESAHAASQNLRRTYFELGSATPGSRTWSEPGFDACTGEVDHPICNFAVNLCIDPWSSRRLNEIAAARPHFQIYSMPGDGPEHREELLERVGFRCVHKMCQMVASPQDIHGDGAELHPVHDPAQRRDLARFMTSQFFPRQSAHFRSTVADATANARRLKLFRVFGIEAGVMTSEEDEIVGLYNLCVSPKWRGRGMGASIVRSVLRDAFSRKLPVTLQCDPRLEAWYCAQGFRTVGYIRVFAGGMPTELL